MQAQGELFVVATPIGNLADITQRALEVLASVDWVAAEDTRHTRRLLNHYGIKAHLISLHAHNERQRGEQLLERLLQGERGALVSDAGTPLISDPGAVWIARLRQAGVRVTPIPGPSALVAALSAAGLPTDRFAFEGFLPAKSGARRQRLAALRHEPRTLVFYEAPHRLLATLADMIEIWGGAHACVVARELTKRHESFVGETLDEVLSHFQAHPDQVRGELVVLLGPVKDDGRAEGVRVERLICQLLEAGVSAKTAAGIVAETFGLPRNRVYRQVQALKSGDLLQ